MAQFINGTQWGTWSSAIKYAFLSGTVNRNGNTVSLTNLQLYFTTSTNTSASNYHNTIYIQNSSGQTLSSTYVTWLFSGRTSNTVSLNDVVVTVNASSTSIENMRLVASDDSAIAYFTPQFISDVYANDITPSTESFTATVSVYGWGGDASSDVNQRYRELQCWTYSASGLTAPRRWQPVYGANTSGSITVTNSSYGDLTIVGNTRYTLGVYASNGSTATNSQRVGNYVTLAYAPTVTYVDSDSSTADFSYSAPADGGFYTKTYQYSLDNGTTWIDFATSSSSSASSGSFTITNLSPAQSYTLKTRVSTTAGTTDGNDVVFETVGPDKPTATLTSGTAETNYDVINYAINSFNGGTSPALRLYVETGTGVPSTSSTLLESRNSAGSFSYSNTGLDNNQRYAYGVYAQATYNGENAFTWSDTLESIKSPALPTILAQTISYNSETEAVVRLTITFPAGGGYYSQKFYYSVNSTSESSRILLGSKNSGDGTSTTYTVNVTQTVGTTVTYYAFVSFGTSGAFDNYRYSSQSHTAIIHDGPTNVEYELSDISEVKNWLSSFSGYLDGGFLVGNQSQLQITIPENHTGNTTDGAIMENYIATLFPDNTNAPIDSSITIDYVAGQDLTGNFTQGKPNTFPFTSINIFQNYKINLEAYDTLYGHSSFQKSIKASRWISPIISLSAERLNTPGSVLLNYSGEYSRINFGNTLNNGNDCNSIKVYYRLLKYDESILRDWAEIINFTVNVKTGEVDRKEIVGTETLTNIDYIDSFIIEVKIEDHFSSSDASISMNIWDEKQILYPAQYDIEVWDWRTNTFLADISNLIIGDLNITWALNDVEDVSFNLDLLAFEKKCADSGVDVNELLVPYAHDIRIRRNGIYIVGCNLVQANIQLSNQPPAQIQVKATGYLNLLKDQYIMNEAWSGYTYAEIARRLIQTAQKPDCLIKNPTIDIDTSYWLASSGTLSFSTDSHSGDGCLKGSRAGTGWITAGTEMNIDAGTKIKLDLWVKGQSGVTCYIRERKYITEYTGQVNVTSLTMDGTWQHIQIPEYTTFFENGYIVIEYNRTDTSSSLYIDDCYVYAYNDEEVLCNMNIALGADTASLSQQNTRQVNYEVQNVKDAIMELTQMEDDNFDFEFLPNRTFNVYDRKGSDKPELEILYPGNVDSMTITNTADNLANKVVYMGSGIGDERLQVSLMHAPSRTLYGTHESVITDSNISLIGSLRDKAIGVLYDRKKPIILPKVKIRDGSINPANVQTGDTLYVDIQGHPYLSEVKGNYRITKISLTVDENHAENMDITFDKPVERPTKKMVRYIRDTMLGNSVNTSKHWVEIQALMLVGNEYVNVALNAIPYAGGGSFDAGEGGEKSVDNDFSTYAGIYDTTNERKGITIDLGDEYPLDYIKVWHYYADGRTYYGEHLSIGTTIDSTSSVADLDTVLWSYDDNTGWVETSNGKTSQWIQENNVEQQ